jgi:hypothetical protein
MNWNKGFPLSLLTLLLATGLMHGLASALVMVSTTALPGCTPNRKPKSLTLNQIAF